MRVSMHNGREGSARHNDRNFDTTKAQHITPENENIIWQPRKYQSMTFREAELAYYRETFWAVLKKRNTMYKEQRHAERCKTIEQVYTGNRTKPEETLLTIGDRNDNVSLEDFCACLTDYQRRLSDWNREHGHPFHLLNTAVHTDEQGAIHAHARRVWQYETPDGMAIGQNEALKRAGVPLPHPDKPEGRYNNRKMSFDTWARKQWQEVCQAHGLQIETKPRGDGRKHERTADYIRKDNQRAERERERVQRELQQAQEARQEALQRAQDAQEALQRTQRELEQAQDAVQRKKAAVERLEAEKAALHERLTEAEAELAQTADQKKLIDSLYRQLEAADKGRVRAGVSGDHPLLDRWDRAGIHAEKGLLGGKTGRVVIEEETWKKMQPHLKSVSEAGTVLGQAWGAVRNVEKAAAKLAETPMKIAKKIDTLSTKLARTREELAAERALRRQAEAEAAQEAKRGRAAVGREQEHGDRRMARADRLAPGVRQAEANVEQVAKDTGLSFDEILDSLEKESDALGRDLLTHASSDPATDWRFLTAFKRADQKRLAMQRTL